MGTVPLKLVLDLGDDEPPSKVLGKKDEEDRYMILMESGLVGSKHIQSFVDPPSTGKNATSKHKLQNRTDNSSMTTDEDSFLWSSVSTAVSS